MHSWASPRLQKPQLLLGLSLATLYPARVCCPPQGSLVLQQRQALGKSGHNDGVQWIWGLSLRQDPEL